MFASNSFSRKKLAEIREKHRKSIFLIKKSKMAIIEVNESSLIFKKH